MRPIASEQSFVRFPLNELLGTAANIRLLRTLCDEVAGPLSAAEAAERAGLTEAGARRALSRLVWTGFVVRIGEGRSRHFGLRDRDPVLDALSALFRVERTRFDALLAAIRATLEPLTEVRVSWISDLPSQVGEPLHLYLFTDAVSLPTLSTSIRQRIVAVEKEFDLTIEAHVLTSTEAPAVDWRRAILIAGVPPVELPHAASRPSTHADRDRRALRLSEAIAALMDKDASLTPRAVKHLERILLGDHGAASHDLREWLDILTSYSPARLKRFVVAGTPRADRLRQSSPFFAVLTPDERDRVFKTLEESS